VTAAPAEQQAPPLVEVRALGKRYPGVVALDGADLRFDAGSIHGLLGKNGAGKSTLIKCLAGAVSPDEGEILVDGEPTAIRTEHRATELGFAFVHQDLTDIPNLTVAENVMLGLGYPKVAGFVRRGALRRRAAAALDRLEADIDPRAQVKDLSVAQRRLVTIARGLAADARLFVLDEPTTSLTDSEIEHLHKVLRRLRGDGVGIVYVSHRLDEIFDLTDKITVMRDGAVVFRGDTADVARQAAIEHITGNEIAAPTGEGKARRRDESAEAMLEVKNLTRTGAVENVSFALRGGEILGVAGLVGAGRTELMRLLYGADRHTSGEIAIGGRTVKIRSPRDGLKAGVVLLPEDRKGQAAILDFSVRENITLSALPKMRLVPFLPVPSKRREQRAARELVERLSIKVGDVESPARGLSGGNQQKMVLAKWIDSGAEVFIFDEPTQGIDVEGKEEVYALMEAIAERGKGVIFVSSEFGELVRTCDRILVMREGEIVAELDGADASEKHLVRACYGHADDPEPAAAPAGA
jgi:ABC-type sugar transport system ATPase subunit